MLAQYYILSSDKNYGQITNKKTAILGDFLLYREVLLLLSVIYVLAELFVELAKFKLGTWVFLVLIIEAHVINMAAASAFLVAFSDQADQFIL